MALRTFHTEFPEPLLLRSLGVFDTENTEGEGGWLTVAPCSPSVLLCALRVKFSLSMKRFSAFGYVCHALAAILMGFASLSARDYPPGVAPLKPVTLPTPAVHILPNGLRVVVIERHSMPVVTL